MDLTDRSAQSPGQPMRFSTNWLPERDRLDIWREEFGQRFVRLEVEQLDENPLLYDATFQSFGDVSIGTGEVSAIACTRSQEMVGDGNGDIVLLIPKSSEYLAEQGMIEETVKAGCSLVRRSSEVGRTQLQAGEFLTLNLPVERMSERVADVDRLGMTVIHSDNEALRLLQIYCRALAGQTAGSSSSIEGNLVSGHLLDLASLAIGANRDAWHLAQNGGLRAARRLAARSTIRKNAANPEYRIGELAREMRVSESYVRKLLAEGGQPFSSILLEARLDRVHERLNDRRFDCFTISQIALDCGFSDISYFNRAYARHFALTPSATRKRHRISD